MVSLYTRLSALAVISLFPLLLTAQPLEVTNAAPITPENLISNVFLGDGVEVISIQYDGDPLSVGFFNHGEDEVGMQRGIVMTTGRAVSQGADTGVNSPGGTQAAEATTSNIFDGDLSDVADGNTDLNDISRYTITFIPTSDTLRFTYAFGSEEYPEYACSEFNDIFGFFISGPGINGPFSNNAENIALIPNTDLPVRINNVNPGVVGANGTLANCTPPNGSLAYAEFYNNNLNSNTLPVYDGFTDVFIAEAIVMPCSTYTIKLAIADINDGSHDSGVFLEAKSFGTGSLDVEIVGLALDGGLAEGCSDGNIVFSLPAPVEDTYVVEFSVGGTATPDVDYPALPDSVSIPPGDSSVLIPITAFEDFLDEGDETILLSVQRDPCNRDTFTIVIKDNRLEPPDLGPDVVICDTEETQLDGTVPVTLPEPPTFTNTTPLTVNQTNVPFTSEIDVFGVLPPTLGPDVIKMICIDSLDHRWIDDFDFYLVGPDGQFMELSTDNGGNGGNGLGLDFMINTCFTIDAETPINFPGPFAPPEAVPFTGEWQPEGVWSDLWDGNDRRTNGTWSLIITDDTFDNNLLDGTLYSWRICFNPVYQVEYAWEPTTGLSCSDCPNPIASPDQTTTYIMTATDSYGCSFADTITVEVTPSLDMIDLVCDVATTSSVSVLWSAVPGANSYEVSVNGGAWTAPSGALDHTVTGLTILETVTIEVRAIGDCPGEPLSVMCSTLDCTPAVLDFLASDVSCFSGTDGAVQVSVISGTAPFSFELEGQMNDTGIFTGLEAGAYVATVTDGDGCPGPIAFTIEEPPSPGFTAVVEQEVSCFNGSDGALTVDIADGNGPYQFDWGGASADSIATGLGEGMYTVALTDVNGCDYSVELALTQPTELTAVAAAVAVDCNGAATGSASVVADGGTGDYTYAWSDGQATDMAIDLTAATYQVVVTDDNGCQVTQEAIVDQPTELTIMSTATPVNCFDGADGALNVEAMGGSPDYTYAWIRQSDGTLVSAAADATDLLADNYQIVVTDAQGCEAMEMITVTSPTELTLNNLQVQDPSCEGAEDGVASIEVIGGAGPYTIMWDDVVDDEDINTLGDGAHSLMVVDANDCSASLDFVLTAPAAVSLAMSTEAVDCFGAATGTATVEPQGGTGPYTFAWEDGQDTQTAIDLGAGDISVLVTDSQGCTAEMMTTVDSPEELEVSISGDDPSCNAGTDGTATVMPTGGTAPYAYNWDDGQNTQTATGLSVGQYQVVVTDDNGCNTTIEQALNEPTALSIAIDTEEQGCTGPPDGVAEAIVSGGTMPYTYAWSDGQTSAQATELTAGDYIVVVTDAQGCTDDLSAAVGQAQAVAIANFTSEDVSCNGGTDGQISVTAAGGEAPYSYDWSEASIPSVADPSNLPAGTFTVTVTDNNACSDEVTVTIDEPTALALASSVTHVVCAGEQTGAIDLAVNGGTQPYQYAWSNGSTLEDEADLSAGDYTVFVTDALGCAAELVSTVDEAPPLTLRSEMDMVNCYGQANGAIRNIISGGQAPYTIAWSDGDSQTDRANLIAGEYDLLITDDYGCDYATSFTITEPDELTYNVTTEPVSCFGGRDGMIQVDVSGGTPSYRYQIGNEPYGGSSAFIGLGAGSYTVNLRDANGCESFAGLIDVVEPDPVEVDLGQDLTITYGDSIEIVPAVISSLPIVSYSWTPVDSSWVSCADCPSVWASPDYQADLFLEVMNENGCIGEDWLRIVVRKDFPVHVATGFTPNNDNTNDLLMVHGQSGIQVLWFRVFDRWGEEVYQNGSFEVNDPTIGWDGTFRDQQMNGGVYLWQIEAQFPDGKTELFTGQTTLIR